MGQRYIQAYAKLASKDNTIVLPAEPIRVQEQVSKSLHLMQGSGSGYSDKQQ